VGNIKSLIDGCSAGIADGNTVCNKDVVVDG